jgi:hypothetical protein
MADFKYLNTLSAVTAEGKSEVGRQIEADVLVLVKYIENIGIYILHTVH